MAEEEKQETRLLSESEKPEIKLERVPKNVFEITLPEWRERRFKAFKALISGRTPLDCIKERPGRGGSPQKYVDVGYMTEQANLLYNFEWTHEVLQEVERTNGKGEIVEVGAFIKVTVQTTSHTSWGQKDVARYTKDAFDGSHKAGDIISLFDDKKAAISDGIKKCLSYFGIAADVYAGKELEFYMEDMDEETKLTLTTDKKKKIFTKYMESKGLLWSQVFKILEVKDSSEITDWEDALKYIRKEV